MAEDVLDEEEFLRRTRQASEPAPDVLDEADFERLSATAAPAADVLDEHEFLALSGQAQPDAAGEIGPTRDTLYVARADELMAKGRSDPTAGQSEVLGGNDAGLVDQVRDFFLRERPELRTMEPSNAVEPGGALARDAERVTRAAKNVGAGLAGTAGSMASALPAFEALVGIETPVGQFGTDAAAFMDGIASTLSPKDPGWFDAFFQGTGSALSFFVPGRAVGAGVAAIAKSAPKVAAWAGVGTATVLEAGTEAGNTYQEMTRNGASREDAARAANRVFWWNVLPLAVTNRYGLLGPSARGAAGVASKAALEGTQETIQGEIQRRVTGREAAPGERFTEATVGAAIGGGIGGIEAAVTSGSAASPDAPKQEEATPGATSGPMGPDVALGGPEAAAAPPPPAAPSIPAAAVPPPVTVPARTAEELRAAKESADPAVAAVATAELDAIEAATATTSAAPSPPVGAVGRRIRPEDVRADRAVIGDRVAELTGERTHRRLSTIQAVNRAIDGGLSYELVDERSEEGRLVARVFEESTGLKLPETPAARVRFIDSYNRGRIFTPAREELEGTGERAASALVRSRRPELDDHLAAIAVLPERRTPDLEGGFGFYGDIDVTTSAAALTREQLATMIDDGDTPMTEKNLELAPFEGDPRFEVGGLTDWFAVADYLRDGTLSSRGVTVSKLAERVRQIDDAIPEGVAVHMAGGVVRAIETGRFDPLWLGEGEAAAKKLFTEITGIPVPKTNEAAAKLFTGAPVQIRQPLSEVQRRRVPRGTPRFAYLTPTIPGRAALADPALGQTLPAGQVLTLDRPLSSDAHDPKAAREVAVPKLENVLDPEGLLDPTNADPHREILDDAIQSLNDGDPPASHRDIRARVRQELQRRGFDGMAFAVGGDAGSRGLVVFDDTAPLGEKAAKPLKPEDVASRTAALERIVAWQRLNPRGKDRRERTRIERLGVVRSNHGLRALRDLDRFLASASTPAERSAMESLVRGALREVEQLTHAFNNGKAHELDRVKTHLEELTRETAKAAPPSPPPAVRYASPDTADGSETEVVVARTDLADTVWRVTSPELHVPPNAEGFTGETAPDLRRAYAEQRAAIARGDVILRPLVEVTPAGGFVLDVESAATFAALRDLGYGSIEVAVPVAYAELARQTVGAAGAPKKRKRARKPAPDTGEAVAGREEVSAFTFDQLRGTLSGMDDVALQTQLTASNPMVRKAAQELLDERAAERAAGRPDPHGPASTFESRRDFDARRRGGPQPRGPQPPPGPPPPQPQPGASGGTPPPGSGSGPGTSTAPPPGGSPPPPPPRAPSVVEVQARREIRRLLQEAIGAPIRRGLFKRPHALGITKIFRRTIRSRELADLETLFHEAGHALEISLFPETLKGKALSTMRTTGKAFEPWAAELLPLATPGPVPLSEGFAEFMRLYIANPANARRAAPTFFERFDESFQVFHPELHARIEDVRSRYGLYAMPGNAMGRAQSMIVYGDQRKTWKDAWGWSPIPLTFDWLYAAVVDEKHPIAALGEAAQTRGIALRPEEDPIVLAAITNGSAGVGYAFTQLGTLDFATREVNGESLRDVLQGMRGGRLRFWDGYLLARRTLEKTAGQGKATGLDVADATRIVDEYGDEFDERAQRFTAWHDRLFRFFAASGFKTTDQVDRIFALNRAYAPLYRVHESFQRERDGRRAGPSMNRFFDPIKRFKGGNEDVHSPTESAIRNAMVLTDLATKNELFARVADLMDRIPGSGQWMEPIDARKTRVVNVQLAEIRKQLSDQGIELSDPDADAVLQVFRQHVKLPSGEDLVAVWRNGKVQYWQVNDELLLRALESLTPTSVGIFLRIMNVFSRMARAGITGVPRFVFGNIFSDQLVASIQSDTKMKPFAGIPDALMSLFGADGQKLRAEFYGAGGGMATIADIGGHSQERQIRELMRTDAENFRRTLFNPLRLFEVLVRESELLTRTIEYKRTVEATGSRRLGAMRARKVSVDFGRHGFGMAAIDMMVPFFRSGIQGLDRTLNTARTKPARFATGVAYLTTLSVVLYLANQDDEEWRNKGDAEKDVFWYVPLPGGERLRLRKPHEYAWIPNVVERVLEWVKDRRPDLLERLVKTTLRPVPDLPVPFVARKLYETGNNWDFFFDRSKFPEQLERYAPEARSMHYTTETAKALAKAMSKVPGAPELVRSPVQVDALIYDFLGARGSEAAKLADLAGEATGILPPKDAPAWNPTDWPLLGSFLSRYPTMSAAPLSAFGRRWKELEQVKNTLAMYRKQDEAAAERYEAEHAKDLEEAQAMKPVDKELDKLRKRVRELQAGEGDPRERRVEIDATIREMIEAADRYLDELHGTNRADELYRSKNVAR